MVARLQTDRNFRSIETPTPIASGSYLGRLKQSLAQTVATETPMHDPKRRKRGVLKAMGCDLGSVMMPIA